MKPLIFIAGGSKGLGKSLCDIFVTEGWDVIEMSRSGNTEANVHHIDCDFSDTESVNQTFQTLFKSHRTEPRPKIKLIINTATLGPFGNIADATTENIEQHLNINIISATLLLHQFSHAFQKHTAEKSVAYISSGAARRNIEGLSLYCASKAALERMILTFNDEQQQQALPINSLVINPGVMDTSMQQTIREQKKEDFPLLDHWTQLHQQGQLADTQIVAKICHQLIENTQTDDAYHIAQSYI